MTLNIATSTGARKIHDLSELTVLLAIPTLAGGGAERVITWLAKEFLEHGATTHLLTMSDDDNDAYQLPKDVNRHSLALTGVSRSLFDALFANIYRFRRLRDVVKTSEADVVISFTTSINVLMILACLRTKTKAIVAERSNPKRMKLSPIWRFLRKFTYRFADTVVVQTDSVVSWATKNIHVKQVVKISNPVVYPLVSNGGSSNHEAVVPIGAHVVLGVGRLVSLKGFDSLVNAFQRSIAINDDWHLVILGDGPEYEALKLQAKRLGLSERVHMPGRTDNVTEWYVRADIFVLASHFEGFPNVLVEAMAHEVAVISTDCDFGPREIIDDGDSGFLVPVGDVQAMSDALKRLIVSEDKRAKMAAGAKTVRTRYAPETIFLAWVNCVDKTLS